MWRAVGVLLAILLSANAAVTLAESDTSPPELVDFDIEPSSVDVTGGPATLNCVSHLRDSPAGSQRPQCRIYSPSGSQDRTAAGYLTSGDIHDGVFTSTHTIPQYAEEGQWYVATLTVSDKVGNHRLYTRAELVSLGFPTTFDVISNQDIDPPELVDFDIEPSSVDVTGGPATLNCVSHLRDSPAGSQRPQCRIYSPSGSQDRTAAGYLTSGDIHDGVFTSTHTIPQYAEEGQWYVGTLTVSDKVGNHRLYTRAELVSLGFPTTFDVISNQDIDPPELVDFDIEPSSVDVTGGPATLNCVSHLRDSPAGSQRPQCRIYSPSGSQDRTAAGYLTSGDIHDGVFTSAHTIPQYAEEGQWYVGTLTVSDKVGNHRLYTRAELVSLGFPTTFEVGFNAGDPRSAISSPPTSKAIRGNSVTIRAKLTAGDPSAVSDSLGVLFEYRPLTFGGFEPVPARNSNHPNPDTTYPYFVHWDVSGVAEGDYELRAIAHDLDGNPDPAPETITITIDHGGPVDVDENENPSGLQESRTAVDDAIVSEAGSGDHSEASTATEFIVPAGALTYSTDTTVMTHLDPATEISLLEQPEQDLGSYVDVVLESGQTVFEGGATSDLNISYSDRDQDAVVDGTNVREDEIELRYYDDTSGTYLRASGWIVMTEHNMVHADIATTGRYALAGPLQPRIQFDGDKQSLTWDLVAEATSYNVYRGPLAGLVDADQDGLPDDGYGDCQNHRDPDTTDAAFVDDEAPAGAGAGFFFVVSYVGATDESTLGNTSQGLKRGVIANCP